MSSVKFAEPGTTLKVLGHSLMEPVVQTRLSSGETFMGACGYEPPPQRFSIHVMTSAAAAIGSLRIDIGIVPACPCSGSKLHPAAERQTHTQTHSHQLSMNCCSRVHDAMFVGIYVLAASFP